MAGRGATPHHGGHHARVEERGTGNAAVSEVRILRHRGVGGAGCSQRRCKTEAFLQITSLVGSYLPCC